MERAGKSVWAALRRIAKPEKPLDLLAAVWPLMVGSRLAAHTRPVGWNGRRLDVAVDENHWHAQLECLRGPIRAKVNAWWGGPLVREVRFVLPKRSRRAAPSAKPSTKPVPAPVSEAEFEASFQTLLKELEGSLAEVSDEELRELIVRVASKYLARSEKT
jgi:predicted nucleic acid-binding Zn ribbon protein